MLYITQIKMMW